MTQGAPVDDVAFGPGGAMLLTAGETRARLWDATGTPVSGPTFSHQGRVASVAFSPDGRVVLTASDDGTARLWDAGTGKLLAPPLPHHAGVVRAAFARNGEVVWTASMDHTLRCWRVPSPVQGDAERVALWVQVLTCMEMAADGSTHELDAEQWNDKRRQLEELGGPPAP